MSSDSSHGSDPTQRRRFGRISVRQTADDVVRKVAEELGPDYHSRHRRDRAPDPRSRRYRTGPVTTSRKPTGSS